MTTERRDLHTRRVMALKAAGLILGFWLVLLTLKNSHTGFAQTPQPEGPVYVVQEGDSLWEIAAQFGVSLTDLQSANGNLDPASLRVGARLVIPGLEGMQGVLTTRTIPYGETLTSLQRRYRVPLDTLLRLNHLTSPAEVYAGTTIILPEQNATPVVAQRATLAAGQSLFELAVLVDSNPWTIVLTNALTSTWNALPGDVLQVPGGAPPGDGQTIPGALPAEISAIQLKPDPYVQGEAATVQISGTDGLALSGNLLGHTFLIFPDGAGKYAGLQGIHALAVPGLYPLVITATLPDHNQFVFAQDVLVKDGGYVYDPVLKVDPETIDPAVTGPEDRLWASMAATVTLTRTWTSAFQAPVAPDFAQCYPSRFGNRRSFNGSAYTYFHSGLDFCGEVGNDIYAAAAGRVVFAGPLTVRGNAMMIDHGWGVYTGYLHQSEFKVKVGDVVKAGQLIGLIGKTGRVTGPHLHWEVWVNDVQVDPMNWLKEAFP